MSKAKKFFQLASFLLIVSLVLAAAGCGQKTQAPADGKSAPAAQKKIISIATATVGGSYYPIGVGISQVIKQYMPGMDANVVVTGGAGENAKLVGEGENDIGFSNSNLIYDAYNGQGDYKKKYTDLRVLFSGISPGAFQVAVKADSNIKSFADLKGKRVAVGPQGGASILNITKVLEIYGLKVDDIKASFMGYDDGYTALSNGQVEAALNTAPLPTAGVKSLAASNFKLRLLGMEKDKLQSLLQKYPYFVPVTIPKNMYGLAEDTEIFGTTNLVIISSKISDEQAYQITKAVFEHLDVITQSHPSAKSLSVKAAIQAPIPIHPGAEKYYREVGALK